LRVELDRIGKELQVLSGSVEEIGHRQKQENKISRGDYEEIESRLENLENLVSLNQERIIRLEKYLNFETTKTTGTGKKETPVSDKKKTGKTVDKNKKPVELELYKSAKAAFDGGDFKAARKGFQVLIKNYPKAENADNAQFWIGETYYNEKWYEKAILEYQKVIDRYPSGNKVRASLLKQGFAFFNLGDNTNSRLILKELISKYPQSNEAEIAKKKLKSF